MNTEVRSAQDSNIPAEFGEFYQKYSPAVYRVCFSFVKNEADALDLMQDTFLKYLEAPKKPEGDRHEIAWLVTTAGNLCRNYLKSFKVSRRDELRETDITAGGDHAAFELLEAVLRLPDKYKTAVYLYYYEGFDTNEIARLTGAKPSTVRSYLKRARTKLKGLLADE